VFQLYLEHLIYFLNVSSETWNAISEIWIASTVNIIHVPFFFLNWNVFGVVPMLQNFNGPLKIKGELTFFSISGATCPNQEIFNLYHFQVFIIW
jgi:hypothetical protein